MELDLWDPKPVVLELLLLVLKEIAYRIALLVGPLLFLGDVLGIDSDRSPPLLGMFGHVTLFIESKDLRSVCGRDKLLLWHSGTPV